jgi:hypothetical protein
VGTDALSHDDTTVSALARHLGVAWHTASTPGCSTLSSADLAPPYQSWLQNQPKEFTAGMIPNLVGSSKRLSLLSTGV